jgi:hypothetical protein
VARARQELADIAAELHRNGHLATSKGRKLSLAV